MIYWLKVKGELKIGLILLMPIENRRIRIDMKGLEKMKKKEE